MDNPRRFLYNGGKDMGGRTAGGWPSAGGGGGRSVRAGDAAAADDGGLCRRTRLLLRRQPSLRRRGGRPESRPQCPHGTAYGGTDRDTLRDRRPGRGGTPVGERLPGRDGGVYPPAAGGDPAAAGAAAEQELRRQELLDTLDSWLRCMGNQRRMARELHLHYNTVSYRLQQLWMLLAADPADPVKRLTWETALYLYRYRRA